MPFACVSSAVSGVLSPSPTGTLHLGNLRTALLPWLSARAEGGECFLRIDDLDGSRNRLGAVDSCPPDLRWLGLCWDGPVCHVFQSPIAEASTPLSSARSQAPPPP